jgi:hypothetical protein
MSEDLEVRQGDCISSIAFEHGFFWDTLWNHPNNADLKQKRKDPNVLMEGDVVHIPDLTPKVESGGTDQRHRFRLKGVPAKFKLRLMLDDRPRANEPYRLNIDGHWHEGTTDHDGCLKHPIPPNAQSGTLIVGKEESQDTYHLKFGSIDPLDSDEGIRGRLLDLGYGADDLAAGLRAFQQKEGLQPTGRADDATRAKLKERFGQ